VRRFRPRRIVEVGSGHSTRFLARAAADGETQTHVTAIDPAPRATLCGLAIETLRMPVQQAGTAPFAALAAGDLLFIDSSHKLAPGSDVEMLLEQVLPALPSGVHVHFHDIFLPDDYPPAWAWRNYNEQAGIGELLEKSRYAIEFSSAWIRSRHPQWVAQGVLSRLPLLPTAIESSLWLRKLPA
ncbi:MAG TPA: class I SAM-dependent methyltransferase, partial [Burkholderiales bacterium]|nr:class I SAM-dependent methyltransferase [Burkholderiales bacterium]